MLPRSSQPATPHRPLPQRAESAPAAAIQVVLSEIGWVAMSIVDTIMVGRLSPAAIGAFSLGTLFAARLSPDTVAVRLLQVAAVFQVFDGIQAIGPMVINMVAYEANGNQC